jgi:hypothetical protein
VSRAARSSEGETATRPALELWFDGAYAVSPPRMDPLGSVRLRTRGDVAGYLRVGAEWGTGLACVGPCRASRGWGLQIPLAADVAYVLRPVRGWALETAVGYAWFPTAASAADATWSLEQGPNLTVRAAAAGKGRGPGIGIGIQAQLSLASPRSRYDERQTLVLGPLVGCTF